MKDVMLDFETLGNGPNAGIIQIGACYFDRATGEICGCFKCNVDAVDAVRCGGVIDASTVYWWLGQSREAIESVTEGISKLTLADAMTHLNAFLKDAAAIWSHATFDFVILQETLKRLDIKPSFSYRAARDIRTLVDLAGIDPKSEEFTNDLPHDALQDCLCQVKYCVAAMNKLGGVGRK